MYTLGDESNVAGSTNAAKINTLEVAMGTTSSSGTIVGNLTGGINLYASGNFYSYYPVKTSTTTKAQLKEKMKTSLQFDTPPILHAKTEYFSYYNGNSYGHYIAVSSINISTDIVVLRDCNNNSNYVGTFQVSLTEVYNSITAEGGRYIICLTQ